MVWMFHSGCFCQFMRNELGGWRNIRKHGVDDDDGRELGGYGDRVMRDDDDVAVFMCRRADGGPDE